MKGKIDTLVSESRRGRRKKRRRREEGEEGGRRKGGRNLHTGRFAVLLSVLGVHEL